jgi:hypothetical protein
MRLSITREHFSRVLHELVHADAVRLADLRPALAELAAVDDQDFLTWRK